ncbi:MAG TPA: hypothetical protein PK677_16345 [Acidiphilium sp.]|nr:hypothetical protein [Acidiphilium sp.]
MSDEKVTSTTQRRGRWKNPLGLSQLTSCLVHLQVLTRRSLVVAIPATLTGDGIADHPGHRLHQTLGGKADRFAQKTGN